MLNIVGKKKIWFTLSGIAVAIAIIAMVGFGFHESADFRGGTLWEFSVLADSPSLPVVQSFFATDLGLANSRVTLDTQHNQFIARFDVVDETAHQQVLQKLKLKWPSFQELSFQSIGPSVGATVRKNAIIAILLVLVGISLYIAFAFRKTARPVSSWKYGWITLLTLFHDVVIPAGLLATLGHFRGVEIDTNAIVALLVVMGFSVHDTIVVFDRVRENLLQNRGKQSFAEIVNTSVNQTLGRSINTSLTLILVLVALLIVGPADLWYFMLTLLVGVVTGIYSSIFVASPMLVAVSPKEGK